MPAAFGGLFKLSCAAVRRCLPKPSPGRVPGSKLGMKALLNKDDRSLSLLLVPEAGCVWITSAHIMLIGHQAHWGSLSRHDITAAAAAADLRPWHTSARLTPPQTRRQMQHSPP